MRSHACACGRAARVSGRRDDLSVLSAGLRRGACGTLIWCSSLSHTLTVVCFANKPVTANIVQERAHVRVKAARLLHGLVVEVILRICAW